MITVPFILSHYFVTRFYTYLPIFIDNQFLSFMSNYTFYSHCLLNFICITKKNQKLSNFLFSLIGRYSMYSEFLLLLEFWNCWKQLTMQNCYLFIKLPTLFFITTKLQTSVKLHRLSPLSFKPFEATTHTNIHTSSKKKVL